MIAFDDSTKQSSGRAVECAHRHQLPLHHPPCELRAPVRMDPMGQGTVS